jgi:tripartite-type tricarboxylate transporter receptor subunit TctC
MTVQSSCTVFCKVFAAALLTAAGLTPPSAKADPVSDFYRGKTVNVLIGVGAGGEYDLQARLVAKYIGRHIPGNPSVVPQNMTGASGLKMQNYLYVQAPRDGTYIGMSQNAFPAAQAVGLPGIQFDAAKFAWLGSIAPVVETMTVWHTSGIASIDDARKRETVAGATSKGAITYIYPAMMNEFFGTRFSPKAGILFMVGFKNLESIRISGPHDGVVARRVSAMSLWPHYPQFKGRKFTAWVPAAGYQLESRRSTIPPTEQR